MKSKRLNNHYPTLCRIEKKKNPNANDHGSLTPNYWNGHLSDLPIDRYTSKRNDGGEGLEWCIMVKAESVVSKY